MTYSELLHSVRFDDLEAYIIKYHGHGECMAWYKIHYDMLCQMTPHRDADTDEDGNDQTMATVEYYIPEEDEKDVKPSTLEVFPLEGDLWEVALARELIVAPDVTATKEEIAACCLWHTSFYGFTPIQRECFFREEDGVDAEEAKRYKRMFGSMVPSKKQMLRKRAFHNMVRSDMRVIRRYRHNKTYKKNGYTFMDRKRKWRMWKRESITSIYNSIIADIGKAIEMMHRGESVVAPPSVEEMCKKLFWGRHCHTVSFQTYVNDADRRCEYLEELITKYDAYKAAKLAGAIACLSSAAAHPVTMEEMRLVALATKGCKERQYCVKTDDSLGKELRLSVAFYEELKPDYHRYSIDF